MASDIASVLYTCDWKDEHGDICGRTEEFAGVKHADAAREVGWGWYENATIRWERWGNGARVWFCPVHATVFRNNHGWGSLESYGVPVRWWLSYYFRKDTYVERKN